MRRVAEENVTLFLAAIVLLALWGLWHVAGRGNRSW